jgi:mannose-6-phosphate isomerase-like protein (cupin superfamily)
VALLAIATSLCLSASSVRSYSQDRGASTYSRKDLVDLARQMREGPGSTDNAKNGLLERHLDPITILAVRTKSGRAELHTASADTFFVVQGHATLVTGGTIINPQGKGEVRGDSVLHGVSVKLRRGDVAHIPAETPHQLLLDGSDPFVYVLIKTLM